MKTLKSKIAAITIALFFMFSMISSMMMVPSSKAVRNVTTYAYLAVNPSTISLGESAVINVWIQPFPPTDRDVLHKFSIAITKPDGTTETQGPLTSTSGASQYFVYTPTALGAYTFKFTYPGESFAGGAIVYSSSESPISTLIVQQESIPGRPEAPLPTSYWTNPINAENRLWDSISGNWLIRGYNTSYVQGASDSAKGFNPYSQAPLSAHIMWTKELALGGIIGGDYGATSFYTGLTYEQKLTPPVIIDGKMYYRIFPSDFGYYQGVAGAWPGAVCVDLRTGQELWRNTNMNLDAGQIYNYVSGNQMGGIPYLWDLGTYGPFAVFAIGPSLFARPTTWHLYDGNTGVLIANFTNALPASFSSAGTVVYGADGTMYVYFLSGAAGWFAMWNSTKAMVAAHFITPDPGTSVGFLRNLPGTYDWRNGIEWNVTIPIHGVLDVPSAFSPTGMLFPAASGATGNVMVAAVESRATSYMELGYSLITGQEMWAHNLTVDEYTAARAFGNGVYAGFNPNKAVWFGYDVNTGTRLWTSDAADYPWGSYGLAGIIVYDKLYSASYDGSVHAYDIKTGKQVFKYYSGNDTYRETPYGTYPFYYGPTIANGVVFAGNGEHSPSLPLYRGYKLHSFNASTGTPIWNISGWMAIQAIADGYLVTSNAEDNSIYVFGKGPSAMTVAAPDVGVTTATPITIKGTVIDISAGAQQQAQKANFPNGLPCVSDASMTGWMQYVYMQQPCPTNVMGVPVSIDVLDSNGNYRSIGTATSDGSGTFAFTWTPDIPGDFTVIATFAGSESYYPSNAETHFYAAVPAPTASPAATAAPSMADLYFVPSVVAIIVVIIIVGAVLAVLMLRKRP
jgi:WD40 repeat protein